MTDDARPLADPEIACCAVMADMGHRASPDTFRRLVATIWQLKNQVRRLEATVADLITTNHQG